MKLDDRLVALGEAVEAGRGIVPVEDAAAILQRAGERLGHGVDATVVALAGATGSGKSSLFNAVAGEEVSTVGVRRPTTSTTTAAVWGGGAEPLLEWLAVARRHAVSPPGDLGGLVLLDLPDHDSTALAHRAEVDRIVSVADMVVWVLDPQKYADAAVHEGYLQPLAGHAGVLLVVLNQADRLDPDALAACRRDLARLLGDDGLGSVPVLATSATTREGLEELRAVLAARVAERKAAVDRLAADVRRAAGALEVHCEPTGGGGKADREALVDALAGAGGVSVVVDAVARSHRRDAVGKMGWPFTRWVRRLRPDPLRRLHLDPGARSSLPAADDVSLARLRTAVRDHGDRAGSALPAAWAGELRREVGERADHLAERLDATVAGTDLGTGRRPRWWSVVGVLQQALAAAAVAGAVWLTVLFALGYLRLPEPDTPEVGAIPLPTALLVGGALLGLVLAAVVRPLAAVGARRRARRAERRLRGRLAELADDELLGPAAAVADRHRRFCEAVRRAA